MGASYLVIVSAHPPPPFLRSGPRQVEFDPRVAKEEVIALIHSLVRLDVLS